MPRLPIWTRVRARLRRNRLDDDLAEEIRLHIDLRRRALIDAGMDPRDAAYEARKQFGNATRFREESRSMWGFPSFDTFAQDVRFGARLLRRSPVFTAVAVLSLAIGIGTAAAVFSLADSVLFRKLPVRSPDDLVVLRWAGPALVFESLSGYATQGDTESSGTSFSHATYETLRDRGTALADIVGFADMYRINIGIGGEAELANGHAVSGNFFDVLGVPPALGRPITIADDNRAAPLVAMIAHGLWQRRFGGAPDVIGRSITINSLPVTIVGVMPRGFQGTLQVGSTPAVMVPLASLSRFERTDVHDNPNFWWVLMMGRLKPGVRAESARPALEAIMKQSMAANRPSTPAADLPRLDLLPGARGQHESRDATREPLLIMAAVVAIVLLVACANIANLLLARASARTREIAVRTALGAPRARIVRQLMTESLLLGLAASGLAIVVMTWVGPALLPALEQGDPLLIDVTADAPTAFFAVAISLASSIVFGLFPALRGTAIRVASDLQETGRGSIGASRRFGVTGALVSVQVALSLLLVSSAALLTATVRNLERIDPGFDPHNLLLFRIDPSLNGYEGARLETLYESLADRMRALPGVVGTTAARHTLIANSASISEVFPPGAQVAPTGRPGEPGPRRPLAWRQTTDERFFETMRIPLIKGRGIGRADSAISQKVAVVNEAFVRVALGGAQPLGRRFRLTARGVSPPEYEIVGVVADARFSNLRDEAPPTVYLSYRQDDPGPMTFAVRTAGEPLDLVPAVRGALAQTDANVPMFDVRTQSAQIAYSLRRERLFARLAASLSGIALLLSAIGLYGLLAYWVARRTPEIGVRIALGAARRDVRWMVLRQSLTLVIAGLALGLPAAIAGTRVLASLLFGLSPTDPLTLGGASAVLVLVALAASSVPARRATRVDPIVALRQS